MSACATPVSYTHLDVYKRQGFPPFAYLALLRAEAKHAEPPLHFLQEAKSFLLPAARAGVQDVLLPAARAGVQDVPLPTTRGGVQDVLLPATRGDGGRRPDEGRSSIELHGPLPAPMPRRAGFVRHQLIVSSPHRRELHAALSTAIAALYVAPEARRVRWSLDVDPLDLY